jgi:tetraacyldisaccharide 4'-kinase
MDTRAIVEAVETYVTDLILGRRHSRADTAAKCSLFALSRVYRSLVQLRLSLYQQRLLRDRTLGCLVVSIGNLTVGGTGKTPVVEVFSRILTAKGRRVAILSRGYRNRSKPVLQRLIDFSLKRDTPPRIVSDGSRLLLDSEMAGDEPYMLASNLKDVIVLVDKDRVKSGRFAINYYDVDTLILDDGFQYLPLKPTLNILLIDSTSAFANHHLLPRGLLREPIKNIRRADYIFLTKSSGGRHLRHLKRFIKRHNHQAEIIECTHKPQYLQNIYSKEQLPLDYLSGKRISSICGIAAPESFERFLRRFGAELVYVERFADHHRYTQQEVIDFINASIQHGAELVLTTEKDAVRFPMLERRDLTILLMRVEIDILSGHENFNDCISRICFSQVASAQVEPIPVEAVQ